MLWLISLLAKVTTNAKAGVERVKKLSTRIDLTPMVDLGFLLITFFIFTTTMSQPTVMKLAMPDDRGNATPTKESSTLTLLPALRGTVYYYEGKPDNANFKVTTLKRLRDVIIDKKRRTAANDLFVIIKPANSSVYGDVVNVLDEMTINNVKRYALVDITEKEETLIQYSSR